MKKRPGGILAFAVIDIIISFFALFGGIMAFVVISLSTSLDQVGPNALKLTTLDLISYGLLFPIGIVGILAGVGVLLSKEWGRKIIIGLAAFSILSSFFWIIVGQEAGMVSITTALSWGFNGLIIWYFNKKHIKSFFK